MRFIALFLLAILFIGQSNHASAQEAPLSSPRNVIFFITDGFGPSMSTLARDYQRDYLDGDSSLVMDAVEVGSVRTFSTSSRVTDSAASATAYATGVKTYNGAIGVDSSGAPVGTLLEAAHARGMLTGVVSTTRITHATPAAFTAHAAQRALEQDIAEQQIRSGADLILGGGRRNFVSESDGGTRKDGRNLLDEAAAAGYTVAASWEETQQATLPLLALLDMDSLPYEVDRDDDEPSLADLTQLALDRLSGDEAGFFVMIEAARIDHAAHSNDAAGTLHDVLAYDRALAVALDFADRDGNTLVVSVADHDTGGLSLGRGGQYTWQPEVLGGVRSSHGPMIRALERGDAAAVVLRDFAGIDDLSDEELEDFEAAGENRRFNGVIAEAIARRAGLGWTTGGHTGVDVKLYAAGPGRDHFIGNHDNTYIADIIADLLELDLAAETSRLRAAESAEVLQD